MLRAEVQQFSLGFEMPFGMALALLDSKLNEFTARLSDPETGFGVRPEQIRMRQNDILYGYELTATFYGGNAVVVRDAQQVRLTLTGGRTASDFELIANAVERFCTILEPQPPGMVCRLWANAHAAFATAEDAQKFFNRFLPNDSETHSAGIISRAGAVGFIQTPDRSEHVRLMIEPSILFQDAAFLSFNTTVPLTDVNVTFMRELNGLIVEGCRVYGLDPSFPE